jgi:hypothetical protein
MNSGMVEGYSDGVPLIGAYGWITMKAHELAHQLLDGPDVPAVVPTYDDQDRELHVEVRNSEMLLKLSSWYDTKSIVRRDPVVELTIADAEVVPI